MSVSSDQETDVKGWAIVEVMGHRRVTGYVSVDPVTRLIKVRPYEDGEPVGFESFYGSGAIFGIHLVPEDVGKGLTNRGRTLPVHTTGYLEDEIVDAEDDDALDDDYEPHTIDENEEIS